MSDTRNETEKPAADEIEVTDEMIEAGVEILLLSSIPECDAMEWKKTAREVFLAMMAKTALCFRE